MGVNICLCEKQTEHLIKDSSLDCYKKSEPSFISNVIRSNKDNEENENDYENKEIENKNENEIDSKINESESQRIENESQNFQDDEE